MTEQEWLTSTDPSAMLRYLTRETAPATPGGTGGFIDRRLPGVTDRQSRLFACACCRLNGVEDAEGDRLEVCPASELPYQLPFRDSWAVDWGKKDALDVPQIVKATILRDIIGNPWRPGDIWRDSKGITDRYVTPTVADLAQQIYDNRTFGLMPILADTLEEVGCTEEGVLEHCRGQERCPHECCNVGFDGVFKQYESAGPDSKWVVCERCKGTGNVPTLHVRGCWVLDLILGK